MLTPTRFVVGESQIPPHIIGELARASGSFKHAHAHEAQLFVIMNSALVGEVDPAVEQNMLAPQAAGDAKDVLHQGRAQAAVLVGIRQGGCNDAVNLGVQCDPGGGITLGPAMTFGFLIGEQLAGQATPQDQAETHVDR